MKRIPAKHRETIKYLEYCKVSVRKFGVCATNKDTCEQLPVGVIGCLLLGPGTSVTAAAVREIVKAGCSLCFCAGGGIPLHAAVFSYRNAKNASAQLRTCFDDTSRLACAKHLMAARNEVIANYCDQLPPIVYEGAKTVEEILLIEARWAKHAYEQTSIETAGERYGFHKRERPIALYNFFVYNLVHSLVLQYGYVPDVGVIHSRTKGGGLVFDVADVFKPALTLMQSAFAGIKNATPNQIRMEVLADSDRLKLKKRVRELLAELFPTPNETPKKSQDTS